ncbi:transcription elongation factor [Vararia minispora EC-137]|uniref:Transcription elongation factor n=1 Tax=Vararia minispora EC-137 TaxID=1314806 RepID=A0ACB8QBL7_9AGAM|nr:transcription elongation factor [Vararia minispora EC-137]
MATTDVNELKRLVKALQGASNDKETIDVLNVLKNDAKINEGVLRESKAGLAVGKLRTHASKDVADLAKDLVKKWRAEVDREKVAAGKGKPTPARKQSLTPSTPTVPARNGTSTPATNSVRTTKTDGVNTNLTGDKTRDKCIELIYDGLAADSGFPSELLLSRAKAVEDAVRSDCGGTTAAYKSKIRSLFVNLKDKNNATLRDSVASGDISAAKFARMSSADMASEERKAMDKKIEEENFFKTLGAAEQQAETDAFQCGRCKQRKCRYRQAQTRSADEPMTVCICANMLSTRVDRIRL